MRLMKIGHKNDGRNLLIRDRNENGHFLMRCPFCFLENSLFTKIGSTNVLKIIKKLI